MRVCVFMLVSVRYIFTTHETRHDGRGVVAFKIVNGDFDDDALSHLVVVSSSAYSYIIRVAYVYYMCVCVCVD